MFENSLEEKFKKLFKVKKVTFDQPSESREQDVLFLEVDDPNFTIKDGRAIAKIMGSAQMFGRNDSLTFGFFQKAIQEADNDLTKDLYFYDVDINTKYYRNLVGRSFSFIYFFDSQYDPDIGNIDELTFEE